MNAKQRFFDAAFNNEPCIGATSVNSCKAINVTKHQLFDVANSNINEFLVCWFVLFWDVFTVPVNHL